MSITPAESISPLVNQELEHDRHYHPNLGGVTRGGLANHYPMTLLALSGLGASDDEVQAFKRSWPRHRATIVGDLGLVDRGIVTTENWPQYLGRSDLLLEFRRVFEALLADGLGAVTQALDTMQRSLPMGLFHPLIRLSFAVVHGDRGLTADALAYMAIRYFDLYRADLPEAGRGAGTASSVWEQLTNLDEPARLIRSEGGASIRICEKLCADPAVHRATLPSDLDLSAATLPERMREITTQAIRLYLFQPSLTTLHAVTSAQALADLTLRAPAAERSVYAALWGRYWIWLTSLYLEKGRPTDLPASARWAGADLAEDWSVLSARARAIPEVHLIKMVYSCRWLDETFGPELLYKAAVVEMLSKHSRRATG